jgi:predicted XRE-type DNA-binding protein
LYRIANRQEFAARVAGAIRATGLTQIEVSIQIGVAQPQLSKLVNGELGALREDTLRRVLSVFHDGDRANVAALLLSPGAKAAQAQYNSWLAMWITDRLPGTELVEHAFTTCLKELDAFWAKLGRRGHVAPRSRPLFDYDVVATRFQLALYRALDALLHYEDSGGIERDWRELSDEEFRRFVRLGLERELILLNRAPDVQRAQRVGGDALPAARRARKKRRGRRSRPSAA